MISLIVIQTLILVYGILSIKRANQVHEMRKIQAQYYKRGGARPLWDMKEWKEKYHKERTKLKAIKEKL